jgi:hypothetical protein
VPIISAGFSILLLFVFITCFLPEVCASAILYLPNVLWSALLLMFEVIDFSKFALTGVQLSFGSCVSYYCTCVFATDKWNVSPKMRRWLILGCIFTFAVTMFVTNV